MCFENDEPSYTLNKKVNDQHQNCSLVFEFLQLILWFEAYLDAFNDGDVIAV